MEIHERDNKESQETSLIVSMGLTHAVTMSNKYAVKKKSSWSSKVMRW